MMAVMEINEKMNQGSIQGLCDVAFEAVKNAFINNFNEHAEVGASLCIRVGDEVKVDLWGGLASVEKQTPWEADTVSVVFSCTKAAVALCAHILIDRGDMDLFAPVTDYWPEFGQNGKEGISVAMILNHSAGLPAFREPIKPGGYYDWAYMINRLENEAPFWEPGTRNGYHMISFGWTVGELVARVSGKTLGDFFIEKVAGPLGLDFWIGLPEEIEPRVSPMILFYPEPGEPVSEFTEKLISDPASIQHLSIMNSGGYDPNAREAHAAMIGGGGGITNARHLSGMYAPLAASGKHENGRLLTPDAVARMGQVSMATGKDATLLIPTRFTLGFMKSMDNRHRPLGHIESAIIGEKAFGHGGAGGSLGFADPECSMAFGYTMNKMGNGILLNERGQSLVDAAYRCLGYRSNRSGAWIK
jgi:CubicO group peptidase (beta-lactamase class C family)